MPRIVRNQAEALAVSRLNNEEKKNLALSKAEELLAWAELPETKTQRDRLKKEVEELEKKILKGQCKDYSEYIGLTTALKHKLSLEEEIIKQQNIKNLILNSNNPKGES